jgi:hypothetical protein
MRNCDKLAALAIRDEHTDLFFLAGNTIITTQCHSALLKDAGSYLVGPVKLAAYGTILSSHEATWSVIPVQCSGGMGATKSEL